MCSKWSQHICYDIILDFYEVEVSAYISLSDILALVVSSREPGKL